MLGRELEPVADATLLVQGGQIIAAGPGPEIRVPEAAEVIDASGTTLAPGFIDAHVHIGFFEPRSVVAGGTTTVRDLAWPPELIFPMVEASRVDDYPGPTILAAGPMITAPGGYPTNAAWAPPRTGREVTSPGDGRTAVAEAADQGATIIKIALDPPVGPVLDAGTLAVIVDAAHERGLKVTGHISGLDELRKALAAGVDELAHMLMSAERIPDPLIEEMVAAGMAVVSTLSIRFARDRKLAIDNLRRFREAGGRVLYGTDLGNEGPQPGIDKREVRALERAGLDALDIIRAATVEAAEWLGLERVGVLAENMDADIIAFTSGDALSDARALTEVSMVIRRGRRIR